MKRFLAVAGLLLISVQAQAAPPPKIIQRPLTLMDAYDLALKQSEKVAVSAEEIRRAEARFYRAFNYFLPTVNFQMTRRYQDAIGETSEGGISSDATRRNTPENKFTFTQPIFSGFREFAAVRASGADKKEQERLYQRARELLFVDVANAFYNVLQARRDIAVLKRQHKILEGRLAELDERIRVGRSRETEKQSSLSDLKLNEADYVHAQSDSVHAVNLLEFYLGEPLGDRELEDGSAEENLSDLSSYLPRVNARADVEAAEQDTILARNNVIFAQADLFPTVYAEGNYYTRRVGFQNGNDWDVTFTMSLPVFDFGNTVSDIKNAAALREQSDLKFKEAKRLAELDIRDAFENFQSSRTEAKALFDANEAAKKDYELQTKDYKLNLVNNLDVLDAIRRYQEVNRRYNQAYYLAKKNFWVFKVALGDIQTNS